MNVVLWVVTVLLALHTAMGAVWKLSNAEQAVPSLSAIPHPVWMLLIGVELLCSVGLILPAFVDALARLVPIAAAVIATEMVLFSVVHLSSGAKRHGEVVYWLVVAAVCGVLAYSRLVLKPL